MLGHKMEGFKGVEVTRTRKAKQTESLVFGGMTPGKYQVVRNRMVRLKDMGFGRMLDRTFITIEPGETQVVRFVEGESNKY